MKELDWLIWQGRRNSIWKILRVYSNFHELYYFRRRLSPLCKIHNSRSKMVESLISMWKLVAQAKLVKVWYAFLTGDIIFTSTLDKDIWFYPYQPQLFASQFWLTQMMLVPIFKQFFRSNGIKKKSQIPNWIKSTISRHHRLSIACTFENSYFYL